MGLKLSDTLRLSWANFAGHKGRTIIVAATVAVLFGLVLGFNCLLNGLKTTLLETAVQPYDGKVYLQVGYQRVSLYGDSYYKNVAQISDKIELYTALEAALEQQYNGKILGEMTYYPGTGDGIMLNVIDADIAAVFGEFDLTEIPTDKVPVLSPAQRDDTYTTKTYDEFESVATYPVSEPGNPTLPGFNPLNLLLWQVYGNTDSAYDYLIKSEAADEFVQKLAEQDVERVGYDSLDHFFTAWPPEKYYVVEFENYEDAANFYNNSSNTIARYAHNQTDSAEYALLKMDIFGRVIYVNLDISNLQTMLVMVEMLFVVVGIIIATLTFKHLIDQDAATIALYRAMGASSANIYLIYFCYLLELCLLAVVMALGIGLALAGVVALVDAGALAERLADFYHLADLPKVWLFGWDGFSALVLAAIMLIAPVAMCLSLRRFSAKHIAKKLKED